MPDTEPTVFVIDDDNATREGLRELMESVSFRVRTFASAQKFLEAYDPDLFGCLLLDVRMPGMSGLKLQGELNRRGADLPIIFITGHGDIAMAVDALKNGAFDFVEKPVRGQLLLDKIQSAIERHRQTSRDAARVRRIQANLALLTNRENEVLDRVKRGQNSKQIARELGLSRKTIDAHMTNIREKMGVNSTSQLILRLHEGGLMQPFLIET